MDDKVGEDYIICIERNFNGVLDGDELIRTIKEYRNTIEPGREVLQYIVDTYWKEYGFKIKVKSVLPKNDRFGIEYQITRCNPSIVNSNLSDKDIAQMILASFYDMIKKEVPNKEKEIHKMLKDKVN